MLHIMRTDHRIALGFDHCRSAPTRRSERLQPVGVGRAIAVDAARQGFEACLWLSSLDRLSFLACTSDAEEFKYPRPEIRSRMLVCVVGATSSSVLVG